MTSLKSPEPAAATRSLIVTADDFGIDHHINVGILNAHTHGILTSASVLVNTPASEEAFHMAKDVPSLEYGLHLAVVESRAFSAAHKTILAAQPYFGDQACLIAHWQEFIPKFVMGRLDLKELEYEFECQFEVFLKHFGHIPFVNGTQHLHLLPQVQDIVLKLAQRYQVKALRAPLSYVVVKTGAKLLQRSVMRFLGRRLASKAAAVGIKTVDALAGFELSGKIRERQVHVILNELPTGVTELCSHPGFDSDFLKKALPGSYGYFDWEGELHALTSAAVKRALSARGIILTTFGAL